MMQDSRLAEEFLSQLMKGSAVTVVVTLQALV